MTRNDHRNGNLLVGLFVGGVIGASLGFLLAPKSGVQLRGKLMDTLQKGKEQGGKLTHSILEMGNEWVDVFGENQHEKDKVEKQDHDGGDIGYVIHEMLEESDVDKNQWNS